MPGGRGRAHGGLRDRLAAERRCALVIPAATAKLLARSLGRMFVLAPLLGVGSVLAGLVASYQLDVPSGPAVVAIAGILFLAAWARTAWRSQSRRITSRRATRGVP